MPESGLKLHGSEMQSWNENVYIYVISYMHEYMYMHCATPKCADGISGDSSTVMLSTMIYELMHFLLCHEYSAVYFYDVFGQGSINFHLYTYGPDLSECLMSVKKKI
eukprot:c49224_g1_i1 orf=404-724(+)